MGKSNEFVREGFEVRNLEVFTDETQQENSERFKKVLDVLGEGTTIEDTFIRDLYYVFDGGVASFRIHPHDKRPIEEITLIGRASHVHQAYERLEVVLGGDINPIKETEKSRRRYIG
ncbi:MAG: hypothetical protein AABY22_00325 [Nanoarchaeota archaeon]